MSALLRKGGRTCPVLTGGTKKSEQSGSCSDMDLYYRAIDGGRKTRRTPQKGGVPWERWLAAGERGQKAAKPKHGCKAKRTPQSEVRVLGAGPACWEARTNRCLFRRRRKRKHTPQSEVCGLGAAACRWRVRRDLKVILFSPAFRRSLRLSSRFFFSAAVSPPVLGVFPLAHLSKAKDPPLARGLFCFWETLTK